MLKKYFDANQNTKKLPLNEHIDTNIYKITKIRKYDLVDLVDTQVLIILQLSNYFYKKE